MSCPDSFVSVEALDLDSPLASKASIRAFLSTAGSVIDSWLNTSSAPNGTKTWCPFFVATPRGSVLSNWTIRFNACCADELTLRKRSSRSIMRVVETNRPDSSGSLAFIAARIKAIASPFVDALTPMILGFSSSHFINSTLARSLPASTQPGCSCSCSEQAHSSQYSSAVIIPSAEYTLAYPWDANHWDTAGASSSHCSKLMPS